MYKHLYSVKRDLVQCEKRHVVQSHYRECEERAFFSNVVSLTRAVTLRSCARLITSSIESIVFPTRQGSAEGEGAGAGAGGLSRFNPQETPRGCDSAVSQSHSPMAQELGFFSLLNHSGISEKLSTHSPATAADESPEIQQRPMIMLVNSSPSTIHEPQVSKQQTQATPRPMNSPPTNSPPTNSPTNSRNEALGFFNGKHPEKSSK